VEGPHFLTKEREDNIMTDINQRFQESKTKLMFAVARGDYSYVRYLLACEEVDVFLEDDHKCTAIDYVEPYTLEGAKIEVDLLEHSITRVSSSMLPKITEQLIHAKANLSILEAQYDAGLLVDVVLTIADLPVPPKESGYIPDVPKEGVFANGFR